MKFSVVPYENVDKEEFFKFCKEEFKDTEQPAHVNMWHDNWSIQTHTLPYLLEVEKRFLEPTGKFFVLFDGTTIVGCSGVYRSDFSEHICIVGLRSWINKDYRAKFLLGRFLYPEQVKWAKAQGFKQAAITFNEYNYKLKNIFLRNGFGVVKNRTENSLFFNGVNEVEFPVEIKYTKQWVLYEKFDLSWSFDYNKIRWRESS